MKRKDVVNRTRELIDELYDKCGKCQACLDRREGAAEALRWALRGHSRGWGLGEYQLELREALRELEGGGK